MQLPEWITLENIYYICGGPLLLLTAIISAGYAYIQIKSAKKEFIINSKRSALQLAVKECKFFADEIIPLSYEISKELEKIKPQYKIEEDYKITPNKNKPTKKEIEILDGLGNRVIELFNKLEGFSLYFVGQIASEEVGFTTTGEIYCEIIDEILEKAMPLIGNANRYQNLFDLYFIWKDKVESQKLKEEKKEIEERLKHKKERVIQSLGTK